MGQVKVKRFQQKAGTIIEPTTTRRPQRMKWVWPDVSSLEQEAGNSQEEVNGENNSFKNEATWTRLNGFCVRPAKES